MIPNNYTGLHKNIIALISRMYFICPLRRMFLVPGRDESLPADDFSFTVSDPLLHSNSNITDCKLRV